MDFAAKLCYHTYNCENKQIYSFKEIFFFVNSWISLWAQSFNSLKTDLCQDIKGVSHLGGALIEKNSLKELLC